MCLSNRWIVHCYGFWQGVGMVIRVWEWRGGLTSEVECRRQDAEPAVRTKNWSLVSPRPPLILTRGLSWGACYPLWTKHRVPFPSKVASSEGFFTSPKLSWHKKRHVTNENSSLRALPSHTPAVISRVASRSADNANKTNDQGVFEWVDLYPRTPVPTHTCLFELDLNGDADACWDWACTQPPKKEEKRGEKNLKKKEKRRKKRRNQFHGSWHAETRSSVATLLQECCLSECSRHPVPAEQADMSRIAQQVLARETNKACGRLSKRPCGLVLVASCLWSSRLHSALGYRDGNYRIVSGESQIIILRVSLPKKEVRSLTLYQSHWWDKCVWNWRVDWQLRFFWFFL